MTYDEKSTHLREDATAGKPSFKILDIESGASAFATGYCGQDGGEGREAGRCGFKEKYNIVHLFLDSVMECARLAGIGRIASGGGERGESCFETRSPSPQPSPPGEGGESAVAVL